MRKDIEQRCWGSSNPGRRGGRLGSALSGAPFWTLREGHESTLPRKRSIVRSYKMLCSYQNMTRIRGQVIPYLGKCVPKQEGRRS